ncbi:hypothetical protein KRMM14A1004_30580 [Krasilnikovia sp. MM14-A1004]
MNQNLIVTGGADAAYPVDAAVFSARRPQAAVASNSGTTSNAIGFRNRVTFLVIITLTRPIPTARPATHQSAGASRPLVSRT